MGGNNLLQPLMTMVKEGLNLPSDANTEMIESAIKENPSVLFEIFTAIQSPEKVKILNSNVEVFATEFPRIIKTIKELNPNAEIMIQTVYNPFYDSKEF